MTILRHGMTALACVLLLASAASAAERALLVEVRDPVDTPAVERIGKALDRAAKEKIGLVLFDVDVGSGGVEAVMPLARRVAETETPRCVAFVRHRAFASGAVLALACPEMVMAPEAVLGNVLLEADADMPAARLAHVRAALVSYSRKNGYPGTLVLGMFDRELTVLEVAGPGGKRRFLTQKEFELVAEEDRRALGTPRTVVDKGKLLALSGREAARTGVASRLAPTVEAARDALGVAAANLVQETAVPAKAATAGKETADPAGKKPFLATKDPLVHVIPMKDENQGNMVDPALAGFVHRKIAAARSAGADLIVFEIDTFGGRVDSANKIVDHIQGAGPIPTVAFLVNDAWSAGALISLACKRVYMRSNKSIGSAAPVTTTKEGTEALGEKYVSAVRAKFKAVAEANGYPQAIAQGMVDNQLEVVEVRVGGKREFVLRQDMRKRKDEARRGGLSFREVAVVSPKGKLVNLTAGDAVKFDVSSGTVESRQDLWEALGVNPRQVVVVQTTLPERIGRILSGPASGLLFAIGLLAIIIELQTPHSGAGFLIGLFCLGLFFWAQHFVGSASPVEIALFLLGFALLAVEVFAIPGFGVCGFSGIGLMLLSLFLTYLPPGAIGDVVPLPGKPVDTGSLDYLESLRMVQGALIRFSVSFAAFLVILVVLLKYFPSMPLLNRMVLKAEQKKDLGYSAQTADAAVQYLHREAVTLTPLHPAGKAKVGEEIVDVVTEGGFIEKDRSVRVVRVDGNRIVVKET
jgi:membrane-bound serine protease (ClpP class)